MEFYVHGQRVSIDYIKEALKVVGAKKFVELNPWIKDYMKTRKCTRAKTDLEYKSRNIIAYAFQDHVRDMRSMGFDFGQIIRQYRAESERAQVKFAEDMRQRKERAEEDAYYAPDNLAILDTMFKFDKKKVRQFERG